MTPAPRPADDETGPPRALTIRIGLWRIIDGTMDNRVALDVVEGLPVTRPRRIRQAGWDALTGDDWPPADESFTVSLRETDRLYLLDELNNALETARQLEREGVPGFADEVAQIVQTIAALEAAWPEG